MLQMERHRAVEYRFAGHSLLQDARAVFRYLRRIERMAANAGNSDCIDIAHCLTDNLLTRAADVVLKERRRLVLLARETPLNLGHIRNMAAVTEMGGIIFPPVPALYQRPQTADDIVTHSVNRALDLFDLQVNNIPRWGEGELCFN